MTPAVVFSTCRVGYQTGEMPANEWLRNIGVQFTIVNIFDEPSPFMRRRARQRRDPRIQRGVLGSATDVHAAVDQDLVDFVSAHKKVAGVFPGHFSFKTHQA